LAISKEKKQEMVAEYGQQLARCEAVLLAEYRGMTVSRVTALRRRLREVDGGFQIVKNTLFERALAEAGIPVEEGQLKGPIAVGYCFGDVRLVTKAFLDHAKEDDALQIRGAYLGKTYLDAAGAKSLAAMPPREVVLAQLLGTVQGPMSSLVSVIAAPLREVAQVLRARSEQGQEAAA
jgi:large subunit ribosomal protein L10